VGGAAAEVLRRVEYVVNLVVRCCRGHQLAQAAGADAGHGGRVEVALGPDQRRQQPGVEIGPAGRILD